MVSGDSVEDKVRAYCLKSHRSYFLTLVFSQVKLKNYVNYMNGVWIDEIGSGTHYFVATEPGSLHYMVIFPCSISKVESNLLLVGS